MLKLGFFKKSKTMKIKKTTSLWNRLTSTGSLVVFGCFFLGSASLVHADQYTNQIQSLQEQNSQTQQTVNQLEQQAGSYQAAISQLQSQIDSIQQNILTNQAEQTQLQDQIQADNVKLAQQRTLLGDDIKAMYADGQLTTVEMLATSKSLSAFVDQQAYQQAIQDKIQATLTQITKLQLQLKTQQAQVGQLITALQGQQSQLNGAQNQQAQLLSYNQQQQTQYNQQIQSNQAQISKLQSEELAANQSGVIGSSSGGAPCGGSASATYLGVTYTYPNNYPNGLCSAPQDSIIDRWNMLNRECVSYTAFMAASESSIANTLLQAHNFGNATDWPGNATQYGGQYGVTVSSTPQVGDVAIRPAIPGLSVGGESDVGHAMYVEDVINSTTIVVGEYNENFTGQFSVQVRSTNAPYNGYQDNLVFINFPSS